MSNYLENRNKRTKKIYNHIENGHVGYESNLSYNTRHISWEAPIFVPPQCWFLRVGITKAKISALGGKEHNVLPQYGSCTGCPNLM